MAVEQAPEYTVDAVEVLAGQLFGNGWSTAERRNVAARMIIELQKAGWALVKDDDYRKLMDAYVLGAIR